MDERVKNFSSFEEFKKELLEKGWNIDTHNFSVKKDKWGDIGYNKIIYFIFTESQFEDSYYPHLVYGNNTYRYVLDLCNIYSCGGCLVTTFITTLPEVKTKGYLPKINQIDFSRSSNFPEIPNKNVNSTITREEI